MTEAIGIRFDESFLKKIEKLSRDEASDRSSILRKLIYLGYRDFIKQKALKEYLRERVSISKAAQMAEMSVWEMEKYLVEEGYKSSYSVEDLDEEMKLLSRKK